MEEHREALEQSGFTRIPGAFTRAEARAMEDRVWSALASAYGAERSDPETWPETAATGLQRLRTHPALDAVASPTTLGAIDALLGANRWKRPKHWGQMLVNFPQKSQAWGVVGAAWHTDFGYLRPPRRLIGLLLFSFISDVPSRSGGTLVVEGSHRLLHRFLETHPNHGQGKMKEVRRAFLASDPWLEALAAQPSDDPAAGLEPFMEPGHLVDGVPVRVVELTGEAGDVILGHPWLLHAGAANCGDEPRMMRAQRIHVTRL